MTTLSAVSSADTYEDINVGGRAISLRRFDDMAALEKCWRDLQSPATNYIYQSYDWVRHAYAHLEADNEPLIIAGETNGRVQFILPLVVEKGILKTVRWAGKNHANLCCGLYSRAFLEHTNQAEMTSIAKGIGAFVNGIAVMRLANQPFKLGEFENPMRLLPNQISSNVMFDMDLSQGMESILAMGNAKRKGKLFRKQVRTAESKGGHALFTPNTAQEISSSLDDFYRQKKARFQELGVPDVFSPPEVKNFIEALANEPERNGNRLLRLFELQVGGKTRAMYGCAMFGDYCQAWINSVTYDDFADHSPGEMVLYLMIEQLIAEGYTKFDLGIGAERYKYSWCREDQNLFDVLIPLSAGAVPLLLMLKAKTHIKARLRHDERIWKHIRRVRRFLGSFR